MMRPDHHDPDALDNMKLWKRYCFHKFTMSSCYGKDVTEMQSLELCHEFYSTYEFDEVCADDELQTKKIIKFRLGGRAHSLTLLEFARRLGLYQAVELEEEGFNVYFEGGLRSDEHFNAQDYCLSISHEENLSLSRSHTFRLSRTNLTVVIHKMITYGLCQRTTRYDKIQKNDLWLLRRKCSVLTEDVVRSLSAPIYCRDLDSITLRDMIDSNGNGAVFIGKKTQRSLGAVPTVPDISGGRPTGDARKAANLDQRLKNLIMYVLPDDQINSVINCLIAKSTWDDLILYHEGPSNMKESRVIDLKLGYNTFKFKEGETLTQTFTRYKDLMNELVNDGIKLSKLVILVKWATKEVAKFLPKS
ncbi:hypothetical protein Tco_0383536 [Tanacetum coccineum]